MKYRIGLVFLRSIILAPGFAIVMRLILHVNGVGIPELPSFSIGFAIWFWEMTDVMFPYWLLAFLVADGYDRTTPHEREKG